MRNKFVLTQQYLQMFVPKLNKYEYYLHLKLCLATATHNFNWMKMYVICEI